MAELLPARIPRTIDPMVRVPQRVTKVFLAYLWSIVFWMSLASVAAWQDKFLMWERGIRISYWTALFLNGAFALTTALLTPSTFAIVHRYPITKPIRFRRVAGYVLGSVVYTIACAVLHFILFPSWNSPAQRFEPRSFHGFVAVTFHNFAGLIWDYAIVVAAAHAYEYFKRARDQELERAELQQALATSELEALKSQLHPHFLFNTLQGISALIDTDTVRAKTMVLKVSSLLRAVLQYGTADLITLDEELKLIEDYLALQKMRLENRLELSWDIHPDTRQLLVPQLIMQPLVENAILHGVACCRGGGWIQIMSRRAEGNLQIQIRNSVGGRGRAGIGLGLQNTKARLKHLYADEAAFSFDLGSNGSAMASLTLPAFASHEGRGVPISNAHAR
jgi:two-component system, LytTR family, sensor kinase